MDGQLIVSILGALGGATAIGAAFVKAIRTVQSWREGIHQREDQAEERLVKRLEDRINRLEVRADADADYIRRLVHALGTAGIAIPSRKEMTDDGNHPERSVSPG